MVGSLVGAVALMAAFIAIELRSRSPLLPLGFFRKRTPTGANIIGFGLGTAIFGMFFLLSLYMQQVLHMSALKTGVGYLAIALLAVVGSIASQALVTKLHVKPVLSIGLALLVGGLVYLTRLSPNGSYFGDLFVPFLLLGVGLGFSFVPISIAGLAGVGPTEAGLASGLINTTQQIGGALGLAILATVSSSRTDHLIGKVPDATALTRGFTLAFWVAAAVALVALVTTWFVLSGKELETAEPDAVGATG